MTRPDDEQEPQNADGVFRPYRIQRATAADDDGFWLTDVDHEPFVAAATPADREHGPRVRRPPKGMRRKDRREWNLLETARVHRLRTDELRNADDGSFRPGFISSPPKFLDHRSRRAWLAIERESSKAWWERRRTRGGDSAVRERGTLIIALGAAALLAAWVIYGAVHHSTSSPPAGSPGASTAAAAAPAAVPSTGSVASSGPVAVVATVAAVPSVGPAGEPGRNGTLGAPGWSPTPSGGVTPIAPVYASTPVDPKTVKLVAAPTGPITKADTATPTSAVAAWAARACPHTYKRTFAQFQATLKPIMTDNAWTAESSDSDFVQLWSTSIVPQQQTYRCSAVTVTLNTDHEVTGGMAVVVYSGLRVISSARPGVAAVVTTMAGSRAVLRQADGRWLVGAAQIGG